MPCSHNLTLQLLTQCCLSVCVSAVQAAHVEQVPTIGEYLCLHLEQQAEQQQQQPSQQCPHHSQQQQSQASSCPGHGDVITGWRWVPDKVLQRHADVIDVATRASRSCNCFTKVGLGLWVQDAVSGRPPAV